MAAPFPSLRPFQREALHALQTHDHVLCLSPTGSGKSLIYEFQAYYRAKRTLLITPLIALGDQQLERLSRLTGLDVRCRLSSQVGPLRDAPTGSPGIWIVSPESLLTEEGRLQLERFKPDFWVVDEAHCVLEWGEGFRPAYAQSLELFGARLAQARAQKESFKSLWLTATLPSEDQKELERRLGFSLHSLGVCELPQSLDLIVERVSWPERPARLQSALASLPGSGVVFVLTRKMSARVSATIEAMGREARCFHSGYSQEERRSLIADLRDGSGNRVIVATSAFGMGVDLPALRWAIMWQMPFSTLDLAQRIGRVGRAAPSARVHVFWHPDDVRWLESFDGGRQRARVDGLLKWLQSPDCRRKSFSQVLNSGRPAPTKDFCGRCDRCFPSVFGVS